jgi:hypothetical protein
MIKAGEDYGPRHCARLYHFVIAVWRAKEAQLCSVKRSWEIIAEVSRHSGAAPVESPSGKILIRSIVVMI